MPHNPSAGQFAQVACLLEATAPKPGNVHRFLDFSESHYLDFALSALAIGSALDRAGSEGVGIAVLAAIRETRRWVNTNTNLGMVLLLAPMCALAPGEPLATGLDRVLSETTIDDARQVYKAIRLARPGGLGSSPDQDVSHEPTVTLLDAMQLSSDRDRIAYQYAHGFVDVLDRALPSLKGWLAEGRSLETAIVATHLTVLSQIHDTLIARKRGRDESAIVSERAAEVLAAGWPDRDEALVRCEAFDRWLRSEGHERNPGTTADLVTAAIFAALRDGTISLPIDRMSWAALPQLIELRDADSPVVERRSDECDRDPALLE